MNKREIEIDVLEHVDPQRATLVLENITIEELKGPILPEHSFSLADIRVEFISKANKRYQARFLWSRDQRSFSSWLYGLDRDREDLESVVRIVASETGGKPRMVKRTTGLFRRTITELEITDISEGGSGPPSLCSRILLSSPPTQERVAYFIESLGKHFRDTKTTRLVFSGVPTEKIPERYSKLRYTGAAEHILKEIDEYAEAVEQYGAAGTCEGYEEGFSVDPEAHPPKWMRRIWGHPGTDDEVLMRLRELKEEYRQVIGEMDFLDLVREPEESEKRKDRTRLDAELEDWTASIDRREVKRWIVEDLRKKSRNYRLSIYDTQSEQEGHMKLDLTAGTLRESKTDLLIYFDDYIRSITVMFVSEANRRYQASIIRSIDPEREGSINLSQQPSEHPDEEDFMRVREIIARETGGEPGEIRKRQVDIYGTIHLKDRPTQSRVADFVERFEEHFRNARIERIRFRPVPEEGPLKEYVRDFVAREILCIFDWATADLDREETLYSYWERRNFYQQLPSFIPKGVLLIMDEQDCKPPLSFKPSDVQSRYWNNYVYVTRGKFLKMKEMYRQVMEEMGLIEPASKPIRSIEYWRQQYQKDWDESVERTNKNP